MKFRKRPPEPPRSPIQGEDCPEDRRPLWMWPRANGRGHKKSRFGKGLFLRSAVLLGLVLAILAAVLLLKGGGLGTGGIDAMAPVESAGTMVAGESPAPLSSPSVPAETPGETIVVAERSILYQGAQLDLEGLRQALLTRQNNLPLVLQDQHAIKAAYDSVKGLLEELAIDFNER